MNKILLAVLAAFALMLPSAAFATEEPETPGGWELGPNQFPNEPDSETADEDAARAAGCTFKKFARGYGWIDHNSKLKIKMWSSVKYDHCNSLDNFKRVTYYVKVIRNDYLIDSNACTQTAKVNINVGGDGTGFNGWNPERVSFLCSGDWDAGDVFAKSVYPVGSEIGIGHDQEPRCAATFVKIFHDPDASGNEDVVYNPVIGQIGCLD